MKAYVIERIKTVDENSLLQVDLPEPVAGEKDIIIKISVCGVCHTELDEIEGRTPPPYLPVVPGHQIVGRVVFRGAKVNRFTVGQRVGVGWIYSACKTCSFCMSEQENLCPSFIATGRDKHGGYAEYMSVPEDFAYLIPEIYTDEEAAPLLCAGAIGYRSLRLTGIKNGEHLGLTGFGASAHLVVKLAKYLLPDTKIFVFARNPRERVFAKELGAVWTGHTEEKSPEPLKAIIDTTPAWTPVLKALENLEPGGRLIINAIRKEDTDKHVLLSLTYPLHLWMEKQIKSVANVTRKDIEEFLSIASQIPIKPEVEVYPFGETNRAIWDLKKGSIRGAKVLRIN
ncbi:MAG: zinc-dependent alcohol dehydrogenase family protein [Syntrophales bacterium]|nr:zinc-dependent alcohol dehydrogenase family protein [Syntrophales bacterium]